MNVCIIFCGMKHANSFCCVDMFKITLIELNTEIFVRIGFSLQNILLLGPEISIPAPKMTESKDAGTPCTLESLQSCTGFEHVTFQCDAYCCGMYHGPWGYGIFGRTGLDVWRVKSKTWGING